MWLWSTENATVNKIYLIFNKGVRRVKIVTKYTVPFTVAYYDSTVALLSQLKEFARLGDDRLLVTRWFWARELTIDRKTLQRWEDEIVKSKPKFAYLFYDGKKRIGKQGLDFYQRFFFALVYSLKEGIAEKEPLTYQGIIQWLESSENGKPRWMSLTRQEFQKWNQVYEQQQAS